MTRTAIALLLLAACLPAAAAAQAPGTTVQEVRGNIIDGQSGALVEGAMVLLFDEADRRVMGVLSGTSGFFRMYVTTPGRYRLRVDRIGYASTDTELFDVAAGEVVQQRVTTAVEPIDQLDVAGASRCEVRPEGVATATLWEEARKALSAATWTAERGMYRFAWMTYRRRLDAEARRVINEARTFQRSFAPSPFVAADPAQLAERGFVEEVDGGDMQYFAPDATVLLSDPFLDTHCFRLANERERQESPDSALVGLFFEPFEGRGQADVTGVIWLERQSGRLRSLEYSYVNHPLSLPANVAGGDVTFFELPNGTWIVKEWRLRMPEIQEERDGQGTFRRNRIVGYVHSGGLVQQAQTASGAIVIDEARSGITGVVVDSAGTPMPDTRVWAVGAQVEDTTDTQGTFSLPALGAGTWVVASTAWPAEAFGYLAQMEVEVGATGMRTVRLELPSVAQLAKERCSATPTPADQATLLGRVVDADGQPVPGAAVRVTWSTGLVIGATGVRTDREGLALFADEWGAFIVCGVPTGTVQVQAIVNGVESPIRGVPVPANTPVVTTAAVMPPSGG
jgi:hypothetical protein